MILSLQHNMEHNSGETLLLHQPVPNILRVRASTGVYNMTPKQVCILHAQAL